MPVPSTIPGGVDPASFNLPSGPIADVTRLRGALSVAAENCNLLGPEMQIDRVPDDYAVSLRVVRLPADLAGDSNGVWYKQEGGKLALHYSALNILAQAAGITWLAVNHERMGEPLLWRVVAKARCRLFDGTFREEIASREVDLRDGSALAKSIKSPAQLAKMRAVGAEQCESKAKARVIRALLGLRSSYTVAEARRPFVVPTLLYMPPNTPEIRQMVAARELGIVAELYGPRPAARTIDVQSEPERLAIVDNGAPLDLSAEAQRLASREPVRGGEPDPEDLAEMPYDDGPPDEPVCSIRGCGEVLTDQAVAWLRTRGFALMCRYHFDEHRKASGGSK